MGEIKQINIKNWTYYFYNNIIGLNDFDAKLLKKVAKETYLKKKIKRENMEKIDTTICLKKRNKN